MLYPSLAEILAAQSPSADAAIKRLFTQTTRGSERKALRLEGTLQLVLLLGANQREAMRACRFAVYLRI